MDFFKNVADSVTKAVNFVVDQNRKAALINRLKIVIGNEKEVKARAYIELGKYYYENMRDAENDETERLCDAVDNSDRRLKKAYTKLDELVRPIGGEEEAEEDACRCENCCCEDAPSEEEAPFEASGFSEQAPPVEAAQNAGDGEAADDGFPLE